MHKRIAVAIAAAAAVAGCGGSSWVDPTSGSFSAQNTADVMSMVSSSFSAVARAPGQSPLQSDKALTQVNATVACAVSGNVTVTGTADGSCNSAGTACSVSGNLTVALNTCTTQNVIGSGGLIASASGSETLSNGTVTSFSVTEHIQGGITVKNAADGSLIGTCGIYLDASVSSDGTTETVHVSGTVCRQAVAQ